MEHDNSIQHYVFFSYEFSLRQVMMMSARETESMIRDLLGGEAEAVVGAEVEVQGTYRNVKRTF